MQKNSLNFRVFMCSSKAKSNTPTNKNINIKLKCKAGYELGYSGESSGDRVPVPK